MKSSRTVNITRTAMFAAAVLAATSVSGCAEEEQPATHTAVCVDPSTEVRVDDDRCDDNDTRMVWWYYPITHHAPAVGHSVKGTPYTTSRPANAVVTTAPKSGGFGSYLGTTGG